MHLTLAIPGLLALPAEALGSCAPLDRLGRYAQGMPAPAGISAAMLAAVGVTRDNRSADAVPAHYAALGAGLDPGADHVLAADPVTLVAGRDDVLYNGVVTDLAPGEATLLIDLLDRHFAQDGLRFAAPRADAWFVRMKSAPALSTTPTELLDGPLRAHLPQGADAGTWRRWGNEIQMLLHDHAVNLARESRGLAPVTGVWFWGGAVPAATDVPGDLAVFAAPGRPGDLARGLARHAGSVAQALPSGADAAIAAAGNADRVLVALSRLPDANALAALAREWLTPAINALERGRLASLTLVADGRGAATWHAMRPTRLAWLKARVGAPRFAVPSPDDA